VNWPCCALTLALHESLRRQETTHHDFAQEGKMTGVTLLAGVVLVGLALIGLIVWYTGRR
jgi:hypothetical protein